jgi:hypothetical protein
VISTQSKTRVTTEASAQDVITVDTGFVSSKKTVRPNAHAPKPHARADIGAGVFICGAFAPLRHPQPRCIAAAVRHA